MMSCALVALSAAASSRASLAAPPIRLTAENMVPACATPERLMAFARARNPNIDPRFNAIADWYKHWGEAWRVRWDYAFFQMALETNYLSYRRPNGDRGDVRETQNNFAGIGATGGGVPGDRFRDVATGVHAQIQHLVAYSGERIASPIAPRTAFAQDRIVEQSQRLRRDVTFGDLARRWAVDRNYARSIDAVASEFRAAHCTGQAATVAPAAPDAPRSLARQPLRPFPPPSGLGGPKPQNLAGPETEPAEVLPWLQGDGVPAAVPSAPALKPPAKNAVKQKPASSAAKKSSTAKAKPKADGPVRTIWSRDRETLHVDTGSAETASPALSANAPIAQTTPTSSPPIETAAAATEGLSFFPTLPLFRIAPPAAVAPSRLGGPVPLAAAIAPSSCRVLTASYGGRKTLLVKSTIDGQLRLTALTVHDGFEQSMFETYARATAPGAEVVGEYATAADALFDAQMNCDSR